MLLPLLDVRGVLPLSGILVKRLGDTDVVHALGGIELDRATGLVERLAPRLQVGRVLVEDAVKLDEVDAPGGELVGLGVYELLRSRAVVVQLPGAAAVVVLGVGEDAGVLRRLKAGCEARE